MRPLILAATAISALCVCQTDYNAATAAIAVTDDPILYWNDVAIAGLPGAAPVQARGFAMVNVAMHDAVNAALGGPNKSYLSGVSAPGGDTRAAAAVAAHDVLVKLNPANTAAFDAALTASLNEIGNGQAKTDGMATGAAYAAAILANRSSDGSTASVPYSPTGQPGHWAPTPPGNAPAAIPQYAHVTPFLMNSPDQFRPGPPPALDSAEYAAAYEEVKQYGAMNSLIRSADQTAAANFWNPANGSNWLRIGVDYALGQGLSTIDNATLFATLMTASADALIAGWDSKYAYDSWRPITAIRSGDLDGNPLTIADPTWNSLNPAPAHPSYISTLSALSMASALILEDAFGNDHHFCTTIGANSRCWDSFEQAALDSSDSRIWDGIHFRFDTQAGLAVGRNIGAYALDQDGFGAVPEPASWAMMIAGFGLVGGVMRWRQPRLATA